MDQRIEKTILFISKNFRRELLLEELADVACLSKFHFQKLFKKETGRSPLQYAHTIRIEYAAHFLVMYPGCTQTDVAFECGFSSPAVFSRSFKQFYDTTPSAFQKKKAVHTQVTGPISEVKLPVTYLEKKTIRVFRSTLEIGHVVKLYDNLIQALDKPAYAYGIYLDAPMHKKPEHCRYYAGLEKNAGEKQHPDDSYEIEEGYYTFFNISGNFQQVGNQLIEFKKRQIDPSSYRISSLIGFERIRLPVNASDFDFLSVQRTIFIKIERA
ncbi:MAG: helix-turn-helix domain-containing protein [Bacteroidia bacterium]|nr:helix-turn-helix domain-containing protein [Bacteroidia bacterium]